jgi:hypothetical protein
MTRHEIRRRLFGDHEPAAMIASKLALLLRLGLVRSELEPETGGRPAERWFSAAACVKSVISVESPPDNASCPLEALATEAAAESLLGRALAPRPRPLAHRLALALGGPS